MNTERTRGSCRPITSSGRHATNAAAAMSTSAPSVKNIGIQRL
jgi:hypothetical protein